MNPKLIFLPLFAMMGLILIVGGLTLAERVRQFKALRVNPQKVATRKAFAAALPDTRCSDNFMNLFEVPVMFHVACVGLYVTQTVSLWAMAAAWLYVALRFAHSFVHTRSNHVMTRFKLFMASNLALILMWAVWGVEMLLNL
jgi:hypothetical protein